MIIFSDMQINLVCVLVILVLFMIKKRNLLTSDELEMCTILLKQFNSVCTTPLPNEQVTDPESFFSIESITSQDDEVFLTNIIKESLIIDSIKELSSNSAAGLDGIPASLLLNCASEFAPSLLILFKQSPDSGVIDPSFKKLQLSPFSSQVIAQFLVTIVLSL